MSNRENYFLDDFLKETETSLEELDQLDDLEELLAEESETTGTGTAAVSQGIVSAVSGRGPGVSADGYAEITVSDDEKRVYANLFPPSEGGTPLGSEQVEKMLEAKGVVYGIRWDDIGKGVFSCNTERLRLTDVLIAEGVEPEKEIPEHYEIDDRLYRHSREIKSEKGRVDYRALSPFVLVKKGDLLARLVPVKPGKPGYTVFGKEIPYGKKELVRLRPGENTKLQDAVVTAACDGRFEHTDEEFWVNEVLAVEGDVGYKTGHIDFPGDVLIQGQIKDDFNIRAGGSVFCEKTMDASEVFCGKDLFIKLGIIGRKKGRVKVGGKLRAKFIENCYVEARGSIYLDAGILNSQVYSSGRVELQKRGVIVGGTVYAQNGVVATQIGTEMGPRTEIYCGVDYVIANKIGWIRDKNIELALTLKRVEEKLSRHPQDEKLNEYREKIRQAIKKLNESTGELIHKLDKNDSAEIVVKGSVFPGVYIEICHVSYPVDTLLSAVRFRLDKEKGRIIPDTLH